jgi:hypothetical protein
MRTSATNPVLASRHAAPECSLRSLTHLQVQDLPRQWMVEPSSHSRPWLGETPTGASPAVFDSQRRESEANGPQGQRPTGVSRGGPSWTEFVTLADQAVVAFAGAWMTNRAERRACGYSREPRRLDAGLGTKGTQAPRQTQSGRVAEGRGATRLASSRGKLTVRHDNRGRRQRGQELMAIYHDARKDRHSGSDWSKPVVLPLYSTRSIPGLSCFCFDTLHLLLVLGRG